jgi:hypothetical protein
VAKDPPPLLGFNNNVRHKGRIFHIQTEDSGIKHPRIVTHLFADGGRIVKTTRTDYAEHVGQKDMMPIVRRMMKEQHKAMFIALRAGELDELLEKVCGPLTTEPSASAGEAAAQLAPPPSDVSAEIPSQPSWNSSPDVRADLAVPPARPGVQPELHQVRVSPGAAEVIEKESVRVSELGRVTEKAATPGAESRRPAGMPPPKPSRTPVGTPAAADAGRYAASRPAAIFGQVPSPEQQSIFGDNVISEKSLDEVILSYLAEDLEGTSQK